MRIALLTQWYPPEPGSSRLHEIGRELSVRGHDVTVITGFPNYPGGRFYEGYRISWREWQDYDGVRVLRLPLYPDHSRSKTKRILNFTSFAASASVLGPFLSGPIDLLWVYHPPLTVGIPACVIGNLRQAPLVYEIQDMWPETLAATGMLTSPRIAKWVGRAADVIYRQSAAITVISPGFKRNLIEKGVPAEKIHVIPNWADARFEPVSRDDELAARHGMSGHFNVVYAGNMGAAQALDNVLNAATLLRDVPAVQFVLIGDGIDEQRLRTSAADRGLTNVLFIGRQPAAAMPKFFAMADVLLIHLNRDPLFEITIPGKTMVYLASGKPIVCAVGGDAAEIVVRAGAGLACTPEQPEELAQAVRTLLDMSASERNAMGESGRREFLAKYTREALMERYVTLFDAVTRRAGHGRGSVVEDSVG
jgi:colanic acid biosynthesis glycosyl transferase WcaI